MAFRKGKVWRFDGIPDFKNADEANRYFDKEQNYWEKGRYGLPGYYYKYLTMSTVRDRYEGFEIPPDYRMVDHQIIFPWINEWQTKKMDAMFITQRGGGKSTIFIGWLPLETAYLWPGCKVIMTSESVNTTNTNFSEKLKVAYEGLNPYYRPDLAAGWPDEKAQKQYIKFAKRGKGKADRGLGSIIESVETAQTQKSPNKLEGQGAKLVLVDEMYKHPHTDAIRSRGAALVTRGREKVGSMCYIGSLSDPTAKGLENAKDMWLNASKLGISTLFVSAAYFNPYVEMYDDDGNLINGKYYDCTIDGNPQYIDVKKATECFKKNRAALEKLPNKKFFYEYILQYPLEINELLEVAQESFWSEEQNYQIQQQGKIVSFAVSENDYTACDRPAFLYRDTQNKTVGINYGVEKPELAKYMIFEEPVAGRTYGIGVDTIPFNTSNTEGSDHVAAVKCFDTNQYVALYQERSYDANVVATGTILLQLLYNNASALVEKNSIGALKTVYQNFGVLDLLAYTPTRFRPKGYTGDRGLNKDRNTAELRQLVVDYLFGESGALDGGSLDLMFMRRFFAEYLKFPFDNTDFMDAMAMCEALHQEHRRIQLYRKMYGAKDTNPVRYKTINGTRVMVVGHDNHVARDGTLDLSHLFKPKK